LIGCLLFLRICFGFRAMAATPAASPPRQSAPQFENPVLWEDLADLDIFRVGKTFYYSAFNMHYSPGAPMLRSYDLVHWEYVGHSLPTLELSPRTGVSVRK
jgi:beta-xylosidase